MIAVAYCRKVCILHVYGDGYISLCRSLGSGVQAVKNREIPENSFDFQLIVIIIINENKYKGSGKSMKKIATVLSVILIGASLAGCADKEEASDKAEKILLDVKDKYERICIVGFSVGATIGWLCSETDGLDGMVGYYGSRIRNYLEINPVCPAMLFFPEREKSFDVAELILRLNEKNVELHQFSGEHGFNDPYSPNHHAPSQDEAHNRTLDFLLEV